MKIRRILPLFLILALLANALACAPAARDTASPSPFAAATPAFTPAPTATPSPIQTPPATPSPEPPPYPAAVNDALIETERGAYRVPLDVALADYDAMWEMILANCPLPEILKSPAYGLSKDVDAIREAYRAKISSQRGDSLSQSVYFFDIVVACLNELGRYGHLYAYTPAFRETIVKTFHGALPDGEGDGGLTASEASILRRTIAAVENPRSAAFYEGLALDHPIAQLPYGQEPDEADLRREVENTISEKTVGGYPCVRASKFLWSDPRCNEIAIELLRAFLTKNASAEHLIVDIRGNNGGGSVVWYEGIVRPLLRQRMVERELRGYKDGAYNRYYLAGHEDANGRPVTREEALAAFSDVAEEDLAALHRFALHEIVHEPSPNPLPFTGRVWLLIDGKTYSAADSFARFCKATGFASLVGDRTRGGGGGGNPFTMVLPETGILLYYDHTATFNADGTINEIVGTAPDIARASGQSAERACLNAIRAWEAEGEEH